LERQRPHVHEGEVFEKNGENVVPWWQLSILGAGLPDTSLESLNRDGCRRVGLLKGELNVHVALAA
jgi:hypothetical protein